MTIPACRIGDADVPHCSGMVRGEGSPDVFLNGIPWSCFGDHNVPHLRPADDDCVIHSAPIAVGSFMVFVNGIPAGRIGDGIADCTMVAEASPNVSAG